MVLHISGVAECTYIFSYTTPLFRFVLSTASSIPNPIIFTHSSLAVFRFPGLTMLLFTLNLVTQPSHTIFASLSKRNLCPTSAWVSFYSFCLTISPTTLAYLFHVLKGPLYFLPCTKFHVHMKLLIFWNFNTPFLWAS